MRTFTTFALGLIMLGTAGTLLAHDTSVSSEQALREARERVARRQAAGPKGFGGATDVLRQEQRKIDELIQDLEAGRRVDPREIDDITERW